MPQQPGLPKSDSPVPELRLREARAERLAEALRANLKRRKAADRARRERGVPDGEAGQSAGPESPAEDIPEGKGN